MKQNRSVTSFFREKRNLIALAIWCVLLLGLIAGITGNAILYQNERIEVAAVYRRLQYALLCFAMMTCVYVVEAIFRIRFPLYLEIALMIFAFISLAGGTVFNFYARIPFWDKVLHTTSGPLFSLVGLCFADILLKDQPNGARKTVAAVMIALFFSLAVGYLWEIFEYTVDSVLPGYNNQRWANGLVGELPNGHFEVTDKRGTALHDTMADMICNLCGTVAFLLLLQFILLRDPTRLRAFRTTSVRKKRAHAAEDDVENADHATQDQ